MSSISAVLIVKNEAKKLRRCLDSLAWVNEIVILDSGSDDDTLEIARSYTDKVFTHTDWQGFGRQRQLAQTYASSEWIFAIDADEEVTTDLAEQIQTAVKANQQNTVYAVNRKNNYFGKFLNHGGMSPDWVVRLYPRNAAQYNDALVHEKVLVDRKKLSVSKLKGRLLHYTYDHLHHYIFKTTAYLKAWADEREGKKQTGLFIALLHAWGCFLKMYIFRLGFLDGRHGFIMAWLGMHSTFVKYIDLWLRRQVDKQ